MQREHYDPIKEAIGMGAIPAMVVKQLAFGHYTEPFCPVAVALS